MLLQTINVTTVSYMFIGQKWKESRGIEQFIWRDFSLDLWILLYLVEQLQELAISKNKCD